MHLYRDFVVEHWIANGSFYEPSTEVAALTSQRRPNVTAHLIVASERLAGTTTEVAERVSDSVDNSTNTR